ncbi:MAG: hypothetical protein MZW92_42590 [Comamonadaceae bacterium]|nr:hypothetical protein [Comamonadaceae bacterium]
MSWIGRRILWETPAIDGYFSELMVADDRRKQGFLPEVALEIFALSMLHDSLFPKTAQRGDALQAELEGSARQEWPDADSDKRGGKGDPPLRASAAPDMGPYRRRGGRPHARDHPTVQE